MILNLMAKAHSFKITLSNNRTELEGMDFVLNTASNLLHPDLFGRKKLLEVLGLPITYQKTFDLVRVQGAARGDAEIEIPDPKSITLIELKTTKKKLLDNPMGFFFGATENEFNLAKTMGNQFNFAFVCLHADCPSVKFLTLEELEPLIQRKRTQFQVNLKKSALSNKKKNQ